MRTNTESVAQPIVTVDVVLLSLVKGKLHYACVQRDTDPFSGTWALPGGWVHTDEDQDAHASAVRILWDKAAVRSPYLEQLGTFSGIARDPRGWSISVAYYALVSADTMEGSDSSRLKWLLVDDARSMPFDHLSILTAAIDRVRSKTAYSSLPVYLMPAQFTVSQLQRVYEQVMGCPLDKRGFRRTVEAGGYLRELKGQFTSGGSHRPAQLYAVAAAYTSRLSLATKNLLAA